MTSLYQLHGTVIPGKQRGKKLGFPTLNMSLTQSIPEGIYVSQTKIAGVFYNSLTFIGAAKTFNETDIFAETYVFDFSQDIYGQEVDLTLLKKLRDNQKFDSEEALRNQMEEDKKQALDFFANL